MSTYTARIHMDYLKDDDAEMTPRAEIDIVYRKLDKGHLLGVEDAYIGKAISGLIALDMAANGMDTGTG